MSNLGLFTGDEVQVMVAAIFACLGLGLVSMGALSSRYGFLAAGLVITVLVGVWIAPAVAQELDPDIAAIAADAKRQADQAQSLVGGFVHSLAERPYVHPKEVEEIAKTPETAMRQGADLMDDPEWRKARDMAGATRPSLGTGAVYVAVSLSMDPGQLRQLVVDADKAGAQVVMRGFVDNSIPKTARALRAALQGIDRGGVNIDPRVFEAFSISHVPVFVSAASPVQSCGNLVCTVDTPLHDRISGNISLKAALEALSANGSDAPSAAKAALSKLEASGDG